MNPRNSAVIGCCLVGALTLAGCSSDDPGTSGAASDAELSIAAAFYPVQFVAEHVGGDLVDVTTLTAPGVEAHDLELSPAAVRDLGNADAVLYLAGFQAAVDSAIDATGVHGIDAQIVLDEHAAGHDEGEHDHEAGDHDHDHDDDHSEDDDHHAHNHDHDHHHADGDPHFWLEPLLLAEYGHHVAAEFGELDPVNAGIYAANAGQLEADLTALDADFTDGLAACARTDLFVGHEAFGYLAERYGLSQHGLAGLDPDAEPSPARIREVRAAIEASGATTIFSESAVDAAAIESLAADAGVATAVLNPIEAVLDGDDYLSVMARNLEALRTGLDCD